MNDVAFLVKNGFDFKEALELDPLLRSSFVYIYIRQQGGTVNWETGEVSYGDSG